MNLITFKTELKTVERLIKYNNTKGLKLYFEKCLPEHRALILEKINPLDRKVIEDTVFL